MPTPDYANWVGHRGGDRKPYVVPGLVAAATQQKSGEIVELTGNGNTEWVPINSDFSANADLAVAANDKSASDRLGYYPLLVPRPLDVFRFDLAAAGANAIGTGLYYSSSGASFLTITAGSNVIAAIVGHDHYPNMQGHLTDDAGPDMGTTIRSTSQALVSFRRASSYFAALHRA